MINEFMFTIAGQRFRADISSIAKSLQAIAEAMKKNADKENKQEENHE